MSSSNRFRSTTSGASEGFKWWPHRIAQRIWADRPTEEDGFKVVRVNAETDLFDAEAADWKQVAPIFGAASTFASMSGYAWRDGVIRRQGVRRSS